MLLPALAFQKHSHCQCRIDLAPSLQIQPCPAYVAMDAPLLTSKHQGICSSSTPARWPSQWKQELGECVNYLVRTTIRTLVKQDYQKKIEIITTSSRRYWQYERALAQRKETIDKLRTP